MFQHFCRGKIVSKLARESVIKKTYPVYKIIETLRIILPNCRSSTLRNPNVKPEAVLGGGYSSRDLTGGSSPSASARKYEPDHLRRSWGCVRIAALQNCFRIIGSLAGTAISRPKNGCSTKDILYVVRNAFIVVPPRYLGRPGNVDDDLALKVRIHIFRILLRQL